MDYLGQICRPPMERASFMLPIAIGCSYNRCKFCNLFKHLTFEVLPIAKIEQEIIRVKNMDGKPETIFLGDGNAFDLPFNFLKDVLELIYLHLPSVRKINLDATVTGILSKSKKDLEYFKKQGIKTLYLGIESGLDDVLKFMDKDHNLKMAYKAISTLHDFEFSYGAHFMTGVSGSGKGEENALAIANFFNETKPVSLINFSIVIDETTPLQKEIDKGNFVPATELENLEEDLIIIENLNLKEAVYDSFHDLIEFRVRGNLPHDKEKMVLKLKSEIDKRKKYSINPCFFL